MKKLAIIIKETKMINTPYSGESAGRFVQSKTVVYRFLGIPFYKSFTECSNA